MEWFAGAEGYVPATDFSKLIDTFSGVAQRKTVNADFLMLRLHKITETIKDPGE